MAGYNQLTLTNIALNMAGGRSQIASLDENSNEAKNAALIFSKVARETLAFLPWDFSQVTVPLAKIGLPAYIPPQWKAAWVRPPDALVLHRIIDGGGPRTPPIFPGAIGQSIVAGGVTAFAVGNVGGVRAVFTNSDAPVANYTAWEPNFDKWNDGAIDLLTTALAAKLAFPISGDKGLRDRLMQEKMMLESRYRALYANETLDVQDVPTDWMLSRDGLEISIDMDAGNNGERFRLDPGLVPATVIPDLPTEPPATGGQFWNDGGLLAITA